MNVQTAVQQQLGFWHGILDGILADCGPDVLNKNLPGATIGSIASAYAHIVFAEDGIVHGMIQGKPTLYESQNWGSKIGVANPGNMMTLDWAKGVKMDLSAFSPYVKAVYAATDAFLAGLSDADLQRKVQSPAGEQTVEWALVTILATHLPGHAGEIAALKGVQGLKGLPF